MVWRGEVILILILIFDFSVWEFLEFFDFDFVV